MANIQKLDVNVLKILRSQAFTVSVASTLTELVQNSLDAKASKIEVIMDMYKLRFLVSDNGVGIPATDLEKLGSQNVTSKIRDIKDLAKLKTYGFKGEAVFCISNVSKVTVISKVKDYSSTWIRRFPDSPKIFARDSAKDDGIFALGPIERSGSGTSFMVENFLYNIPVRRKILQKEAPFKTYMALKQNLFQVLVLHPEVELIVSYIDDSENIKTLFSSSNITPDLATHQKISYAFFNVFGSVVPFQSLKSVSASFKDYSLSGIISKDFVTLKDFQFIYVNGRRYKNDSFHRIVDNMFQTASLGNETDKIDVKTVGKPYPSHALIIIDIRCPHSIGDLMQDRGKNISISSHAHILHPLILKVIHSFLSHQGFVAPISLKIDKRESHQDFELSGTNQEMAKTILGSRIRMAKITEREVKERVKRGSYEKKVARIDRPQGSISKKLKRAVFSKSIDVHAGPKRSLPRNEIIEETNHSNLNINRAQLSNAEVVNQIDKKFILIRITPMKDIDHPSLIIADQHACDERIKLETYLKQFVYEVLTGTIQLQQTEDCIIQIDATEAELFRHYEREFKNWGIVYCSKNTTSGNSCLAIFSLPTVLNQKYDGDRNYLKRALEQIAYDLKTFKKLPIGAVDQEANSKKLTRHFEWWKYINCIPAVFLEIFNSKACRSAIMFGDSLAKSECSLLVQDLAKCRLPFQCAHGRPSMVPLAEFKKIESVLRDSNSKEISYLDYDAYR